MKFTKISQDAFANMQVNAGIMLKKFDPATFTADTEIADEDIVTSTTGGITASCVPTYSDWGDDVDNCPANAMELKHLESWLCKLATTARGATPEFIRRALGAADIDSNDPTKIVPRSALKASDFSDLWWVGDRADGGLVAICLKNALSTAGFTLKTNKNGKGDISVELTGHISIKDPKAVPMEFYATEGAATEGDAAE